MNTDSSNASGRRHPWVGGWRLLGLLLIFATLAFAGWLVLQYMRPRLDPVGREVARIMDTVRAQDESSRPWARLLDLLRTWLSLQKTGTTPNFGAGEELERLGPAAHPFLLDMVAGDRSASVRETAVSVLAAAGATNAWPVILRAFETDREIEVRASAAHALVQLDPDAAVPALLAGLEREKRALTGAAPAPGGSWQQCRALDAVARALGGLKATNAVAPLLELLQSVPLPEARSAVADALGELGDTRAAPALRPLLDEKNGAVSLAAIRSLGQLRDQESLPALLRAMESANASLQPSATNSPAALARRNYSDWEVRNRQQALAEALGRLGDPRATPLLIQAVTNTVEEYELKSYVAAFASLRDRRAIPSLKELMAAQPKLAREAADALVMLGHESVTAELLGLLNAPERDKRVAAAMTLANLGDRSVLTNLVAVWESGGAGDQGKALIEALGIIGDASTVPLLRWALLDAEEEVRAEAAWSLGQIGEQSGAPYLLGALADTNFTVRFAAAFSLAGMTNAAVIPALEKLSGDTEPRVRAAAACAMAFRGSTRALPELALTLRRNDDWQRLAAAMALLRLNTPEARQLVAGMNADRDPALRELARVGLEQGPVPALAAMVQTGSDNHRHYAARMLFFFGDPAARPVLRAALRDPRSEVRVAARVSLQRLDRAAAGR